MTKIITVVIQVTMMIQVAVAAQVIQIMTAAATIRVITIVAPMTAAAVGQAAAIRQVLIQEVLHLALVINITNQLTPCRNQSQSTSTGLKYTTEG